MNTSDRDSARAVCEALGIQWDPKADRPRIKTRRRKKRTSNCVLILLGLFLLAFITTMTVTFWVKGAVPDTLIQYTLGAGGVEALVLAGIKISKVIAGAEPGEGEE